MPFLNDLAALGNNRNVGVLSCLGKGALRFGELLGHNFAAGEGQLNESLRELDRAGLVERRVDPGPPLRVLYALTPAGAELAPTLESLAAWVAGAHADAANQHRKTMP